jgi:hypothetical protein
MKENRRTLFAWQKRTQKGAPSIHLELLQHWRKRQQNGNNKMEKGCPGSSRQQTVKKETTTSRATREIFHQLKITYFLPRRPF